MLKNLRDLSLRHPIAMALILGALVRIIAAFWGTGFHARDDYFHVLEPAIHFAANPDFDWDHSSLAGAGIRSHLVPRTLGHVIRGLGGLGITDPETILSLLYLLLGLFNLPMIFGLWLLGRDSLDEETGIRAAFLGALFFIVPYAGTRLLIEALAMVPMTFGLWFVLKKSWLSIFWGGVLIGLACWLRFQTGIAAVGLAIGLLLLHKKDGGWKGAAMATSALALGGGITVVAQALYDLATTGALLGPVVANIKVNLDPPAGLTHSSFFAYIGFWLLLTIPPASIVILPPLVAGARRFWLLNWTFLSFVLIHSLIAHKEERFMLPVLPIFLIYMAALPAGLRALKDKRWKWVHKFWPATLRYAIAA
ncbi:hypothetical protein KAI87_03610, partial [Myxococcota bacterium]|nr:hypothetical protein [Myxococcota bacterium]